MVCRLEIISFFSWLLKWSRLTIQAKQQNLCSANILSSSNKKINSLEYEIKNDDDDGHHKMWKWHHVYDFNDNCWASCWNAWARANDSKHQTLMVGLSAQQGWQHALEGPCHSQPVSHTTYKMRVKKKKTETLVKILTRNEKKITETEITYKTAF